MKKIIFCFLFSSVLFSGALFAQNGWGVGLFVPLGASIAQYDIKFKNGNTVNSDKRNTDANFEVGASVQPGYFWGFGGIASFGLLLDLGYYRDTYAFKHSPINGITLKDSYTFDSLNIGLYPKINIFFLSIGIGGGVKLPLGGSYYSESYVLGSTQKSTTKLSDKDIRNTFKDAYIPYLKLSLDFLLTFNQHFALVLGLYANYDFPMEYKLSSVEKVYIDKKSISSFDVGFQVGMYIVSSSGK